MADPRWTITALDTGTTTLDGDLLIDFLGGFDSAVTPSDVFTVLVAGAGRGR